MTVYESTDPHITAHFRSLDVREGHGRVLVMQVPPGMPPYTTTAGSARIRVGRDCMPLTGSARRGMLIMAAAVDFTADAVDADPATFASAAALEHLRTFLAEEPAPPELRSLSDRDLLASVGALQEGRPTIAAILLVGSREALARYVPRHRWQYHRMRTDTDYSVPAEGREPIVTALHEIGRYVDAGNTVTSVPRGLLEIEWPAFPRLALREALLNAFGHRDYLVPGAVDVRQYPSRIEITSPGGFIAGITPQNVLHHPPAARNEHLMELLHRLHLVNRANVGVPRIFAALLQEGHEPPVYEEPGESVRVTLFAGPRNTAFLDFVRALGARGIALYVDHLMILHYLLRHREITAAQAAEVTQRSPRVAGETLTTMCHEVHLLDQAGAGRGRYFRLSRAVYDRLGIGTEHPADVRPGQETQAQRVLLRWSSAI